MKYKGVRLLQNNNAFPVMVLTFVFNKQKDFFYDMTVKPYQNDIELSDVYMSEAFEEDFPISGQPSDFTLTIEEAFLLDDLQSDVTVQCLASPLKTQECRSFTIPMKDILQGVQLQS